MPKTILVDFRGGVNERISPHMVGDTQGQAGQDLDLSAVRLQGRRKLDETAKAQGTFYYEVGTATGRWVSTDSQDDTYYAHSTDFAVWNRDLYVAFGVGHPSGEIDVYRDAGDEPLKLSFNPPQAASATGGIVSNTTLEPEVTGQDAVDDSSTTEAVTNLNGDTLQWGLTSQTLHTYEPTTTVASGVDAGDSSRTWYVWQKKNSAGSVISSDFYAQTTSTSGTSFQLHTRQYSVIGEDYALGSDWSQMGYTRTNWNERDDHPDSPNTAPGDSYYKFTKGSSSPVSSGLAVYYQQVTNQTFHTISSGGNWSDVREDPDYSLTTTTMQNTSVKWEFTGGGSGTEIKISQADYSSASYFKVTERSPHNTAHAKKYRWECKFRGNGPYYTDQDHHYFANPKPSHTITISGIEYTLTLGDRLSSSYYPDDKEEVYGASRWRPYSFAQEEGLMENEETQHYWAWWDLINEQTVHIYLKSDVDPGVSRYSIPYGYGTTYNGTRPTEFVTPDGWKIYRGQNVSATSLLDGTVTSRMYEVQIPYPLPNWDSPAGYTYYVGYSHFQKIAGVSNTATEHDKILSSAEGGATYSPPAGAYYWVTAVASYTYPPSQPNNWPRAKLRIVANGSCIYYADREFEYPLADDTIDFKYIDYGTQVEIGGQPWQRGDYYVGGNITFNSQTWTIRFYKLMIPEYWQLYKVNYSSAAVGTATWKWGGTAVKTETGVTAPSAGPHTYSGNKYYKGTKDTSLSTADVMYWTIYRTVPTYNNIVWSSALPELTYSRDTTYTYSAHSDDKFLDGQAYVPDTPVFDRDWSRYKLYRIATASDTLGFTESMWETDAALGSSGAGWLLSGTLQRLFVNSEDGYYVRTVRVENGLPVHSQEKTLVSTTGFNPASGVTYLPRRLNFSITNPTDHNASTWLCWQLLRTDSLDSNLVLGYIKESSISLTTPNSSNNMTLSGLSSSKTYRVKWGAYQDAELRVGAVTSDLEVGGVEIVGKTSETITLIPGSADHWGFDLYVEERLLQPSTESSSGDIWATVRCFDGFKYTSTQGGTSVPATVTASDYLDMFDEGASSSGGLTSFVQEYPPPTYLKFLKESNNFFFGVGTTGTPDTRYKNATVNKSDSYLFISQYNNPRNWPLDGFLEFEDSITGLAPFPGEVLVWTANATYRVFGSAHNAMRKVRLATTEGCPPGNHRTIVQVNQYLLWLSAGGICVYDGASVQNITKSRFTNFSIGSNPHAGQFEGIYYCCGSTEVGYQVNTNLEGFPIVSCDLREGHTAFGSTDPAPVLVYRPRTNRLYSRRGMVAVKGVGDQTDRNTWSYTTRAFDGGTYGRTKLLHSLEINSENCSGKVQVLLDGITSSNRKSAFSSPYSIDFSMGFPITIYLPANTIADTWAVELTEMTGQIDYIACEFEVL